MKKSLFAIAAVTAFAGAAQAQSSVTVYGVADAGIASISNTTGSSATNNNRTTGVQSGGLSSPRLGFKGTEDLGGGNKANFVLEAEILTATGQANGVSNGAAAVSGDSNGQLFNRAAWVGLSNNKLGEIRLGLQNTSGYNNIINFDALKGANLGGAVNTTGGTSARSGTGDQFGNNFGRVNNSYAYITPKLMGFQGSFTQGYKQQTAGTSLVVPNATNAASIRTTDFGLNYTYKKATLAASYATMASSAGTSDTSGTVAGTSMYGLYGMYDFGIATVSAFRTNMKGQGTGGTNVAYNGLGVRAPVTPVITVGAQYTAINAGSTYTNANSNVIGLVAEYAMSKRTTLYALGAMSNNQANAKQAVASSSKFSNAGVGTAGLDQTGYMLGMRHTF